VFTKLTVISIEFDKGCPSSIVNWNLCYPKSAKELEYKLNLNGPILLIKEGRVDESDPPKE
jgi:hypothetical protein